MHLKEVNPKVVKRAKMWLEKSVLPDTFDKIDWQSEIDGALSFNENVNILLERFPLAFREEAVLQFSNRMKQIVFIPKLIEGIVGGYITCTYRKTPKHGRYYVVKSRFVHTDKQMPRCVIEVYRTEEVDPYELKDVDSWPSIGPDGTAEALRDLFRKWYGEPLPKMWRNWFHVVKEDAA